MQKKWMVLWAANFNGLHYFRVMPKNTTVTSEVYIDFLEQAFASFNTHQLQQTRNAVQWENALLMHDNAPVHVSKATTNFLQSKYCTILEQPAYSPDTNICDRMIFPLLEMHRKDVIFDDPDSLVNFLRDSIGRMSSEVMMHEFDKLRQHCMHIIDHNGNFVF